METGRRRFRGVRLQTPNSVSFGGLTELRGENSVSSSQPTTCVPKQTHRVFRRTHHVCRRTHSSETQVRKNSLNIKFLGGIFLGHPGPRRRDIPDKNFMQVAFFCCFRQGVAGMSRDLGRDVPDLEKLYARKLWADFSHPKNVRVRGSCLILFGSVLSTSGPQSGG